MFVLPLDSLGDLQVNSTSSPLGHFLTSYALLASNNNFFKYDLKEVMGEIDGEIEGKNFSLMSIFIFVRK